MRQPLLITLLHRRPLLLEHRVVDVLCQSGEFGEVFEEVGFGDGERFLDEVG